MDEHRIALVERPVKLLLLLTACVSGPGCRGQEQAGTGVVKGKALTPLADAFLYAYREGDDLRGPAFATSEASGPERDFSLALPPGKSQLVLRRRVEGESIGPVATGDYRSEVIGPRRRKQEQHDFGTFRRLVGAS